jgi:hypothetical protein
VIRQAVVLFALSALGASPALAHTKLMSPSPRSSSDGLKSGPCGGVQPTGSPAVFSPGETITVDWLETIDHPGWYRLAFSAAGDGEFDSRVLLDDITDMACGSPPCAYSAQVTLPDEECQGCALQLIQYMTEGATPSLYYSCADVDLVADGPAADAGAGGGGDAGPGVMPVDGGCGVAGQGGAWWTLGILLMLGARQVSRQGRVRRR